MVPTVLGLGMLKRFLHLLPPGAGVKEREKLEQGPPEFQVDELFDVPGVGTVVGGKCLSIIISKFGGGGLCIYFSLSRKQTMDVY
jgi:GTPase